MKVTRTIATGVFFGWLCQSSMAAPPVIERPSPPPCCADGQCFASPMTYGYYDTRWRRWPMEAWRRLATGKPAALTSQLQQEVASVCNTARRNRKIVKRRRRACRRESRHQPHGNRRPHDTGVRRSHRRRALSRLDLECPLEAQPRGATGYPSPGLPTPPQTSADGAARGAGNSADHAAVVQERVARFAAEPKRSDGRRRSAAVATVWARTCRA